MSKKPKLSDNKMVRLVTNLFKKESLSFSEDGKVELTADEEAKIKATYGENFLKLFKESEFSADENATQLFDAAVEFKTNQALAEKETLIKDLQKTIVELSQEPEPKPQATQVQNNGAQKTKSFQINRSASYNKAVIAALATTNPMAVDMAETASGIDIADIKAEFKTAMPDGLKLEILTKRIYQGFADSQHMTRRHTRGKNYIATGAIMSEVSQQFTNKWTPKGTAKFTPLEIQYRRHKINVEIDPTEVIDSWLVDLYEQGKSPDQQPLVHYIVNNHILPRISEDITYSMIGKGKFKKATPAQEGESGSAAVDSMDGYETILVEGKADSTCKINYLKDAVDVRTLSGKDLLDYIEKFTSSINPLFAANLPVYCSPEFLKAYEKADYDIYGKYTGERVGNEVRFSKFRLIALESMYDSAIIFATPKANFVELVDLSAAGACINDVQKSNYKVKIFGEYSLSVGFPIAEAVFASVPAGYVPSEAVISDPTKYSDNWVNGGAEDAAVNDEGEGA